MTMMWESKLLSLSPLSLFLFVTFCCSFFIRWKRLWRSGKDNGLVSRRPCLCCVSVYILCLYNDDGMWGLKLDLLPFLSLFTLVFFLLPLFLLLFSLLLPMLHRPDCWLTEVDWLKWMLKWYELRLFYFSTTTWIGVVAVVKLYSPFTHCFYF